LQVQLSNADYVKAMTEAKYLYERSKFMSKQQRYEALVSLNEWGLFSTGHLVQLSGWSASTIRGFGIEMPRKGTGKFNPKSLDTLLQLRLNLNNGRPINVHLLHGAILDGNSRRIVAKFTGLTLSQISRSLSGYTGTDLL